MRSFMFPKSARIVPLCVIYVPQSVESVPQCAFCVPSSVKSVPESVNFVPQTVFSNFQNRFPCISKLRIGHRTIDKSPYLFFE